MGAMMPNSQKQLYFGRIEFLRAKLRKQRLGDMLISGASDIRYLCGFNGSNALLLIQPRSVHLFTDVRYAEQAPRETHSCRIHIVRGGSLTDYVCRSGLLRRASALGFQPDEMSHTQFKNLRGLLKKKSLVPLNGILNIIRAIKTEDELKCLRKAARISSQVFESLLSEIKTGWSEVEIAAEISYRHRYFGADGDAFEPIVTSGKNTSLIHGRPTRKTLKKNEWLLMDFGCRYNGYCSDMTRMMYFGNPGKKNREVYLALLDAQSVAIDCLKAGVPIATVDQSAREVLKRFGLNDNFTHSIGHGIGLDVHEHPRISTQSPHDAEVGNVITIEPGVYFPGQYGLRIEDMVSINTRGCSLLTTAQRELIAL